MDIQTFNSVEYENICRTCLQSSIELKSLFDQQLQGILQSCPFIQVST